LRVANLQQIKKQIPLTLSKLERSLSSSCFDIMFSLLIHLADEALIYAPISFLSMYFGEI